MDAPVKILFFSPVPVKLEPVMRQLEKSKLRFKTRFTKGEEELAAAMTSFNPEVVVCVGDTLAPAEAGLRYLKLQEREIPLIIITSPEQEAGALELLSAGAEDYLLMGRLERLARVITNSVYAWRWKNRELPKKMEESWPSASEGKYRLLFQWGPLPNWIYDKKTLKILDVNEAAIRHYGYSREEFLGMSLLDLRPQEHHGKFFKSLEKAGTGYRDFWVNRSEHLKKDGTLINVEIFGFNLEFQNTDCALVVCQDITQRKAAFRRLQQAKQEALKLSAEKGIILESIGDAFWAVDNDWKVTYWNKHAAALLNISKEEALGQGLWDLFPDARDTSFYTNYVLALKENRLVAFEEYFKRTGNWFEVRAYPSATGLSVYFTDITEKKKAELQLQELNQDLQLYTEELVAANKGLEQFSYIISHNLRAPVANILGLAEMLKQEDLEQELRKRFEQELVNSVSRLDMVITDLNTILETKGDIGQKRERIKLQELVNMLTKEMQRLMTREKVQLITDFSERSYFHTLRPYLYSIFQNLILNSIKYRHPERAPRIEIRTREREGKILLSFRDNGIGIDLDRKGAQVFGMYKRFHSHVDGKGMGLFMVKTQVELLGGKISVTSQVDKGSEFILEFPDTETKNN